MKKTPFIKANRNAGFSLVEVIIVTMVSGLLLAGAIGLLIASLKFYYLNSDKLSADRDLRTLTDSMVKSGSNASFFNVYTSFTARTASDIKTTGTGDMVVFAFYDPAAYPAGDKVYRIVCYYQNAETNADGTTHYPIRMYDSSRDSASTLFTTPLAYSESLFPATTTAATNTMLAENVPDTATGTNVFCNYSSRSVIVNAKVFYKGTLRPNVSNTYNFTVTPRG